MNKDLAVKLTYFLLRVVVGLMFLQHGSATIFGWFGGAPGGAAPPLMSQQGIGGVLQLVGGLLIALGLFTRPVAFILSGEMAVAYWQFHAPGSTWPMLNKGEVAVLFCFIFLYMAARGGGQWSLDAMIARNRGATATAD